MNKLGEQCTVDELWTPGRRLDDEYPVATEEALVAAWQTYNPDGKSQATQAVYGVYSEPLADVQAVASIDLCEVVRDTVVGLDTATGLTLGRRGNYSGNTWFSVSAQGSDYEKSVVVSVVQAIMNEGLVRPVEHIEAIRCMLQNWRQQGIYCVANTSTLPGCELGTINHTLARDLPDCFDALVLPRNHDGQGPITKAAALAMVAAEISVDLHEIPVVHIDDAGHHIAGFTSYYINMPRLQLFVPRHPDNADTPVDLHCDTPFEAFIKADQHFAQEGVTRAR